jgi:GNAT superfamily N-acetyltransferase
MPEETASAGAAGADDGGERDDVRDAATYRRATHDDYDDVEAFTSETWSERDGSDYIPRIYHDWIEADEPDRHDQQYTCVAEVDGTVVSVAQTVRLSEHEAWCQGMRTDPDYRGLGIGKDLTHEMWDWARDHGATVARNMVFSWNMAGLGHSRGVGFAPATEFRWMHPDPNPAAAVPEGYELSSDVNAAWTYWTASDARDHLRGLGLTADESWATSELTRETFAAAAADRELVVVGSDRGTHGVTYRVRDFEREDEDGVTKTYAEYGVAAWDDVDTLRALVAGIARDAASLDATDTRVLIPETAGHVSDASLARAGISDEPDFVMAADLTADYRADAHLD